MMARTALRVCSIRPGPDFDLWSLLRQADRQDKRADAVENYRNGSVTS